MSIYKIKKWSKMLCGNSVHHVNQNEGKVYSKNDVKGYYNNLTEKVSRFGLDGTEIPKTYVDTGEEIYFSIAIFQYGLGAYDLFLIDGNLEMKEKMLACAKWALENQEENGAWKTFVYLDEKRLYSSMAQGEGTSLLLRAYKETQDSRYLKAAEKAVNFMLLPVEKGGTASYKGDDVYLLEYTYSPIVLNGWIFSVWGLWDYCLVTHDFNKEKILNQTIQSMIQKIPEYDNGYWSKYDDGKRVCSPFYHKLHIAQLNVMYELTGEEVFEKYAQRWQRYAESKIKKSLAFIIKVLQKVFERT